MIENAFTPLRGRARAALRRGRALAFGALLLLSAARPDTARATAYVDQDNSLLPVGNFTTIRAGATAAQTFVVGFPGTLSSVSVVVDPRGTPGANLDLEIQSTSGGVATGTVLAGASLAPFGGVNPTVTFDVSGAGLVVNAGDVLAFVLKSNATLGNDYVLRIVSGNRYAPGQCTDSGGGVAPGAGWDTIFKTRVEPAALPGGPGTSDQLNNPAPTNNFTAILSGLTATQTFTVGAGGTLTHINVMLDPRGGPVLDLLLEVQATTAGAANGTVLARASLPPFGGTNPVVSFDVSPYNLAVTAGEELAFVLKSNAAGGTDYLLRAVPGNTYLGGQLTNSSGGFPPGGGWDAIFETFVYAGPTGVGEPPSPVAGAGPQLLPAAPNPVRRATRLAFTLPAPATVSLVLYDVAGRRVRALLEGELTAGAHAPLWDRTDDDGRPVPAGVYFYRLVVDGESRSRRLVVTE